MFNKKSKLSTKIAVFLLITALFLWLLPTNLIFADGEQPTPTEPAVEEPAVEEPAVEEPAVEEPAVEEPAVEEPAVEEPAVEEPAVEEPAAEEPAVEEPVVFNPVLTTDKDDYNPGELVTIYLSGFAAEEEILIDFLNAEGTVEFSGQITTDTNGAYIFTYNIKGSLEYTVVAVSKNTGAQATTTFTDRAYATWDHAEGYLTNRLGGLEGLMYVDVWLNDGSGGSDQDMTAFCIDTQHYLSNNWNVYGFDEYNVSPSTPPGKIDPTLTWPLPQSLLALANSLNSAWFNADGTYTRIQKGAAAQEAFWHLLSLAFPSDVSTFNYLTQGNTGISALVGTLVGSTPTIVKTLDISPGSDINILNSTGLTTHTLTVTATDYTGTAVAGIPVYLSISGKSWFDAAKTLKNITALSGSTVMIYADIADFGSPYEFTDTISGYVDNNHDQSQTITRYVTPAGSILYPQTTSFPGTQSSNQMMIVTDVNDPTDTATKTWKCPGKVIISKVVKDPTGADTADGWGSFEVKLDGVSIGYLMDGQSTAAIIVDPGSHNVSEVVLPAMGYDFVSINGCPVNPLNFDVAPGETKTIEIINKQQYGKVIVNKEVLDINSADTTDTWGIFKFKFNSGTEQNIKDEQSITVSQTVIPGAHIVEESPVPTGYTFVSIDSNSANEAIGGQAVKFDVKPGQTITVDITNKQNPGSIIINKYGLLPGDSVTFEIDGPGTANDYSFTLSPETSLTWSNSALPWGTYKVTENVPSNYLTPIFTINGIAQGECNVAYVTVGNDANPVLTYTIGVGNCHEGEITVIKKDAVDKSVLAGAVFDLYIDEACTMPAKDASNQDVGKQTSGADGKAFFTNLNPGEYWVLEETAPAGYGLAAPIYVRLCSPFRTAQSGSGTIRASVSFNVCSMFASIDYEDPRIPAQFSLRKLNSVTGLPVVGATYNIYNSSSALVEIVTTGVDGWAIVTLGTWGTYTVKEATAPAGYLLDPATYTVTFSASSTSVTLNVEDSPTGGGGTVTVAGLTEGIQVLAFTGIDPIIPISGGSALIAGLAMLAASLRRRSRYTAKHFAEKKDKEIS